MHPPSEPPSECEMCENADPAVCSPLQRMLPPGQSRIIAQTPRLVAMPTFGSFLAGYVLVIPRAHALSFGCLDDETLTEADELINALAERISQVYDSPVLGFESGDNTGLRRIQHAHWHLVPSPAELNGWMAERLDGQQITSLTELSRTGDISYISVRDQDGRWFSYDHEVATPTERIRLRRVVAELDPRVDTARWDWAADVYPELIRQTVADLARPEPARR